MSSGGIKGTCSSCIRTQRKSDRGGSNLAQMWKMRQRGRGTGKCGDHRQVTYCSTALRANRSSARAAAETLQLVRIHLCHWKWKKPLDIPWACCCLNCSVAARLPLKASALPTFASIFYDPWFVTLRAENNRRTLPLHSPSQHLLCLIASHNIWWGRDAWRLRHFFSWISTTTAKVSWHELHERCLFKTKKKKTTSCFNRHLVNRRLPSRLRSSRQLSHTWYSTTAPTHSEVAANCLTRSGREPVRKKHKGFSLLF